MNRTSKLGLVLILLGIFIALGQYRLIDGLLVVPAISAALLALYFVFGAHRHDGNLGFLIPGCILGVVGLFALLQNYNLLPEADGGIFLLMFGGAFLAVMFIHSLRADNKDWGARYWPIFPAGVMITVGLGTLLNTTALINLPSLLLPIGLIAAGCVIWYKSRRPAE